MGARARKRVEKMFSWEGVAAQLGELYTDLMQPQTQLKPVEQKQAVSA